MMAESTRPRAKSLDRVLVALLLGIFVGMQVQSSLQFGSLSHSSSSVSMLSQALMDLPMKPGLQMDSGYQYELAYNQSYGYFYQSISNNEWKMRQVLARNATFHRYVGHPRRLWDKPNLWYYNNYDPIFSCPFVKRVKGIGDGPKWTCDPHQLRRVARELHQKDPRQPCLLYSVGSNGNYQWEDGIFHETDGLCEIHVFDYSQNYTRKKNAQRNIHFHQWGVQGSTEERRGKQWKSLPEIIQALGHEDRTIQMLKIDCEGCEWDSYEDWIGLGIRQILIETHSLPANKSLGLHFFDSFIQHDYVLYSKEVNPWGGGQYVEFSYLKLHPDFLGDAFRSKTSNGST